MEREREVVDFRVIQVNIHLLLSFPCCLLPPSSDWHVILSQQGIVDICIAFNTLELKGATRTQVMFRLFSEELQLSNSQNHLHSELIFTSFMR